MPLLLAYDLLGKVQVTPGVGSRGGPLRWGSRSFGLIASVQWNHRELALGGQLHQRNKGAQERAVTVTGPHQAKCSGERPGPPLVSLTLKRNSQKVTLGQRQFQQGLGQIPQGPFTLCS